MKEYPFVVFPFRADEIGKPHERENAATVRATNHHTACARYCVARDWWGFVAATHPEPIDGVYALFVCDVQKSA